MEHRITVDDNQERKRIDILLLDYPYFSSRSAVKNAIGAGYITVNGAGTVPSYIPRSGDEIIFSAEENTDGSELKGEDIPLDIVYEDDQLLVINKQRGLVTHPAPGNMRGTLVNALIGKGIRLSDLNDDPLRPGIVHRLDKLTTGLILVAKTNEAHQDLQKQIQDKAARRTYEGLCFDNIKTDSGIISKPIGRNPKDRKKMAVVQGGREAVTEYRVLERFGDYTLCEMDLKTGRTHQIRVHFADMGHPIVGDEVYTRRKAPFSTSGQLLHAKRIEFVHPKTGEKMIFEAPLPEDFSMILDKLRKKNSI